MNRIAIFASGGGSNFIAIHKNILSGYIIAKISIVISNNSNCGAIQYAKQNSIPFYIINKIRYPDKKDLEKKLMESLIKYKIDLICLAGYMKLIPKKIVLFYKNSILNVHPALLPAFGGKGFFGKKVHQAVLNSKIKQTGATVHFVDEKYDNGQIILQKKIDIDLTDDINSIAKKVLDIEHIIYSKVIKAFCEKKILWKNNKPIIEVTSED